MNSSSSVPKVLAGVCVVALLLVGGGILLYSRVAAPSPLVIPSPAPLPSPNGFDMYVAAAQAIIPATPAVDAVQDTRVLSPQQAALQYTPQRRVAWVDANSKTWGLAAKARTMTSRTPPMRGQMGSLTPTWSPLRQLARSQAIRTKVAGERGRWNEALNIGLDNLQMGRDVERGAFLIGSLVGMAIEAIADRSLEPVPSHLDAASAKAGARRLEAIINQAQPFSQVLAEEKWSMLITLRDQKPETGVNGTLSNMVMPPAKVMEITASMMDEIASQTGKPMKTQVVPAAPSGSLSAIKAQILFPVMVKSLGNDARRCNAERMLMLRLALRAYRLEHGSYPAQLGALAPAYIKQLPIDAYGSGEGYRYRASSDSYTFWSIGPDGIDNKGTLIPLKPGRTHIAVLPDSKGDVVARP